MSLAINIWSPLPPSPSGIADYVAESLPALARHVDVRLVAETPEAVAPALRERWSVVAPGAVPESDLDLYHLGNSPPHGHPRPDAGRGWPCSTTGACTTSCCGKRWRGAT